jgi:hypothetical protein
MRLCLGIFLGLMIFAGAASAAEPLTDSQIDGFIGAMPELRALSEKYERKQQPFIPRAQAQPHAVPGTRVFRNSVPTIKSHAAYGEVMSILDANGFSSLEGFAGIADRIMHAYVALQMGAQQPQMNAQLEQAIRQIQQSGMPAEQQQKMIEMLRGSQQTANAYAEAPEADRAAVSPRLPELDAALRPPR